MLQHNNYNISHIYNPLNQSYEELLTNFVIRKKEFKKITKEFRVSSKDSSIQHFLIEGQRGTGKTSLLLRLRYEIENNKDFSHLVAVQFGEEQYGIFDLCRLWEKAAEYLEEIEGFEGLLDALDENAEKESYAIDCFSIFESFLKKNNKRLVLFLDNFGDMLNRMQDIEEQRLRDILHTSKYIQIIAASSRTLEGTFKHDKPFYEFFKRIKLGGLTKEETHTLLTQLASSFDKDIQTVIDNRPNRTEIIRRLTGGIPRTIVLLFEIFLDDSANVFEDLEAILDKVTPLYKHRMDDLPRQQQAIVDTIALNWDGITTKEIHNGLKRRGFDTKQISAQLKVLEKQNIIESRFIDKKNKLYLIKERFFNIWYLMRYGRRKTKEKVTWLVRFLQEWCDDGEIEDRAKKHIEYIREGSVNKKGSIYLSEAYACLIHDYDLQHKILSETKELYKDIDQYMINEMSNSDKELLEKAQLEIKNKKYKSAKKLLTKIQHHHGVSYLDLGVVYRELEDIDNALKYFEIAINHNNFQAANSLGRLYIDKYDDAVNAIKYYELAIENNNEYATNNLANLYADKLNDNENAIKYYKIAIENHDKYAARNLALLYAEKLNDNENAIKYYKIAIENNEKDSANNLGNLYAEKLNDYENAIKYHKVAIENNDEYAALNLALLYAEKLNDYENAIKYYKLAIENNDKYAEISLALLYAEKLNDYENAIKYYKVAIENNDKDAANNLGNLYAEKLNDYENAKKYYTLAIENNNEYAENNLANLYAEKLNDYENAIKYYKVAIENNNKYAANYLANLYANKLNDYDNAIKYYKIAIENNNKYAAINLGVLYDSLKEYENAIKYYKLSVESNSSLGMNNLAYLYYEQYINKEESLILTTKSLELEESYATLLTHAKILLWNDHYVESIEYFKKFTTSCQYEEYIEFAIDYFILLLAKKQYNLAYNLFIESEDLQNQMKPIYYALMKILKDKYPKEYLKMGSELEETVEEILIKVEKKREEYC